MIRTALALALFAGPAAALELSLPIDCVMSQQCYIQSYVDRDPGPGYADFSCGTLSYDGHKGVDFRVATFAEMANGIDILAAAHGVVRATRDGVEDLGFASFPEGQNCGNAIAITHPDGWETRYCHLAKGSVRVKSGDVVDAGDVIGRMGYSGATEFPHLHLTVAKNGVTVDPFGAQPMSKGCSTPEIDTLWSKDARTAMAYQAGGIVDLGLMDNVPNLADIRQGGLPTAQSADAASLTLWTRFYGLRPGDQVHMSLASPDGGFVMNGSATIDRKRAEEMRSITKTTKTWSAGVYIGNAKLVRDGVNIDQIQTPFTLR